MILLSEIIPCAKSNFVVTVPIVRIIGIDGHVAVLQPQDELFVEGIIGAKNSAGFLIIVSRRIAIAQSIDSVDTPFIPGPLSASSEKIDIDGVLISGITFAGDAANLLI